MINKPVQTKIFLQSLVEDGQVWYELCLRKSDHWREMFSDYIEFTKDFNPYAVKIWAYDMIQIIEKFQGKKTVVLTRILKLKIKPSIDEA